MKFRRKTVLLKHAAVESLTLAVEVFNRPSDVARTPAVLIMSAHAFEMLLKAMIYQERRTIRAARSHYTYSLEKCINICRDDLGQISRDDATILLTLKQDRDAAVHEVVSMTESMLWVHVRSFVSVFDGLLAARFGESLADVLPGRVVPVAATPPSDARVVIQAEIEHIQALLAPGTRRSAEARGFLRPLLALDGSTSGRQEAPSELELGRAEKALKSGKEWTSVFPGLAQLELAPYGEDSDAAHVTLRIGRDPEGLPVRIAGPGEEDEALIYREINYFDKYNIALSRFGDALGLNQYEGYALIYALDLKSDLQFYYRRFTPRGNVQFQGLSQAALHRTRQALEAGELTVEAAIDRYRSRES